ncbi:MAG TPA: hypothetical protein VGZ73_09155 [Bryobacteraceae bacterium]|nr:hypothetical protein [Bryobacteraceae bacterium]
MVEANEVLTGDQQALELGFALGQRRAFAMIAGRCSAAQAECLRKIRNEKTYLKFAPNWDEYCQRHLKMSKRTADRVIALLKKHGALCFETSALTGISPAEYARIEHAIQKDGIHIGSEVIALIPGNASRAVDAVAQLQAESNAAEAARPAAPVEEQLRDLEKRGRQLCASFHQVEKVANDSERQWLIDSIEKASKMFGRLRLEIR